MKQYGIMFFVLALWCALLPAIGVSPSEAAAYTEVSNSEEMSAAESENSVPYLGDTELTVYFKESNTVKRLELEEYVALALSAVMAPDSPAEALKAQAIAIRTLALYAANEATHPDYDLCDNHLHCQPVAEKAEDAHYRAVADTAGEILTYGGKAAYTLSHLSSCLSTEPYGEELPYLAKAAVRDESFFECYRTEYSFDKDSFAAAFNGLGCVFTGDYESWIGDISFTEGSRVELIELGGSTVKGDVFAARLGLDSRCFTVSATSRGFTLVCYGSGSGYGMSRCSALLMAAEGMDCYEILEHFYPLTEISGC
ncbi:MAG: SpoIID/LytB domain-containing protein [Clostridia bacterium]|nr:SpoIID/LytB domain-containing protein [Clostridia bacterium]